MNQLSPFDVVLHGVLERRLGELDQEPSRLVGSHMHKAQAALVRESYKN